MADKKETKQILQGVAFHDHTYLPGEEDALEKRLTKESYERLMQQEVPPLAGDWHPKGKGEEPMARSHAVTGHRGGYRDRAFGPHPAMPEKHHPALAENEELRKRVAKLEAELEAKQKAEAKAVESASRAPEGGRHKS